MKHSRPFLDDRTSGARTEIRSGIPQSYRRGLKLPRLLLLLWLAGVSGALAAPGTAFTYQGRLRDTGTPVTGLYDLQFKLLDAATDGAQIGSTLALDDVGVTNGLFSVTLDFGAGVFTGADRWLETALRPGAETGAYATLSPRRLLASVPYAVQAANATSADNATTAASLSGTLPATQLTGTLPLAQLPSAVVTNGQTGITLGGTFTGNGAGVTNVNLLTINDQGTIGWTTNWGNFGLAASPGVGSGPWCVIAADVNGDGKPDLISANWSASALTVLTNNGRGGVGFNATLPVGANPRSVVAADVNGMAGPI